MTPADVEKLKADCVRRLEQDNEHIVLTSVRPWANRPRGRGFRLIPNGPIGEILREDFVGPEPGTRQIKIIGLFKAQQVLDWLNTFKPDPEQTA